HHLAPEGEAEVHGMRVQPTDLVVESDGSERLDPGVAQAVPFEERHLRRRRVMVGLGHERPEPGVLILPGGFLDVAATRAGRRERMAMGIDGAAKEAVDHLAVALAHGVTVPPVSYACKP